MWLLLWTPPWRPPLRPQNFSTRPVFKRVWRREPSKPNEQQCCAERCSTVMENPLSGVTITILNHPEFGQTLSRTDGMFDMAVNGGGRLTINYARSGYLQAQRQVNVPWQDYIWAPDVVLIQLDPQVTPINLSCP